MSNISTRILKELKALKKDQDKSQENDNSKDTVLDGIEFSFSKTNARNIDVYINGPGGTPYEAGKFHVRLYLNKDYPMKPPQVFFSTPIYHPNINNEGSICLDILKDQWSPALQIKSVVLSIQSLLSDPNPNDPLNNEAAELWKTNIEKAHSKAKELTKRYAIPIKKPTNTIKTTV